MKYIPNFIILLGTIFIEATITGTILCLLYPTIHELFPLAADAGIIPYKLSWLSSVCITWIIKLLFKPTIKINNIASIEESTNEEK
jgi:hypothetical protein